MARATKEQTARNKERFLKTLERLGGVEGLSAKSIGISRQTVYDWKQKDKEFEKESIDVKDRCIERVENAVYRKAREGNTTLSIFYLLNRAPEKWQDKRNIVFDGKIESKVLNLQQLLEQAGSNGGNGSKGKKSAREMAERTE